MLRSTQQLFICHKQPATQEVPNDSQAKEVGIGPQWQLQAIGSDMVTSVEELRCLSCLEITPPPKKNTFWGDQGSKVRFAVMKYIYIPPFCCCFFLDWIMHQAGGLISSNVGW